MESTKKHVDQVLTSVHTSFKKRKKRSLIQQVNKRFKKSASFSKGRVFDGNQHEYFMRVFQLEHQFEGTLEEKTVFANNSLAQTEGQEVECSFNQLISRVIERLLPLASEEVLERFFKAFGLDLRPICVHDFASHVLQTLMITAARRSTGEVGVADSNHSSQCKTWLLKVSRYLLNNIEEFMWDRYASHTLKTALFCLAGLHHLDKHSVKKESDEKQNSTELTQSPIAVPLEFKNVLEEFFIRISNWPQLKDLVVDSHSSSLLQALLRVSKPTNKKMFKSLCKKILTECFPSSSDERSSTMFSPTALPVLEVMIEESKGKVQQKIYNQLIAGRLIEMSTTRISHITIQKFVSNCKQPEMVAEIVNVLAPEFHKILASKTDIVLVSLCKACERLKTSQSEFFKALTTVLNCANGDQAKAQIVPAVISLTPLPHETPPPLNKHGSLLIQSLLRFQKPIKLVNSLLLYDPKELADLLSSTYGCYITTAFCNSEFISGKSREKLIKRLMGHYSYLATSKFGSRSFDDIWEVAELKNKEQIVRDLASDFSQTMKTQYGQFVASKVKLDDFRMQGVGKWRQKLQSIDSKKKLFAGIINSRVVRTHNL